MITLNVIHAPDTYTAYWNQHPELGTLIPNPGSIEINLNCFDLSSLSEIELITNELRNVGIITYTITKISETTFTLDWAVNYSILQDLYDGSSYESLDVLIPEIETPLEDNFYNVTWRDVLQFEVHCFNNNEPIISNFIPFTHQFSSVVLKQEVSQYSLYFTDDFELLA